MLYYWTSMVLCAGRFSFRFFLRPGRGRLDVKFDNSDFEYYFINTSDQKFQK